jgi:hypothetical protein
VQFGKIEGAPQQRNCALFSQLHSLICKVCKVL